MATSGDNFSESVGSEDLYEVVCDPCQEDGELHKAVGMCVDCQDHLCQRCFDVHKIARPSRNHELLDKEAMTRSKVSITKDKCTEKCIVHEDKVIEYYCINHSHLGCSACITLDHRMCDSVRYIPHVAKDLANNEEYKQVENQWLSVDQRSKKFTENNKQKTESINKDCSKAVENVRKFRKEINIALDKAEDDLIGECGTMKSEETEKIASNVKLIQISQAELNTLMKLKEKYQNKQQNCNLYTLMMKSKDKLKLADNTTNETETKQLRTSIQIQFVANKETLNILRLPGSFGKMLKSGISESARPRKTEIPPRQQEQMTSERRLMMANIERVEYIGNIYVERKDNESFDTSTGLVVLPDKLLISTDYFHRNSVHLVDIKIGKTVTYLKLSSRPWDVAKVTTSQVAVTIPDDKKIAMVNVAVTGMVIDRTLDVDGPCHGIDYKDGKLAVTFSGQTLIGKVQVLTLQGRVLYTITNDRRGKGLFDRPKYVSFDIDSTSLYVSDYGSDKVVNVKFDGTVAGKYTDKTLQSPMALLTDRSGHVLVCGNGSCNVHQITRDCKKVQVLLTKDLTNPMSISYDEIDRKLYVGLYTNKTLKVYRVILGNK